MENFCVIFGSGEVAEPRKKFGRSDFIISTIGGFDKALSFGISPDAVIGDFSSSETALDTDAFVVKITRDTADTDMLAAVKVGLRRGYTNFVIYGGTGDLANSFANISVLNYLNAYSARGFIITENAVATIMTDGKLTLPKTANGTVSVFAYGGTANGVTLKNLTHPLENAELEPHLPIGAANFVSYKENSANGKKAEISVKHGSLLVFFPR